MNASPPSGKSTLGPWRRAAALLRRFALIAAAAAIFGVLALVVLQLVDEDAGPPPPWAHSPLLAPLPPLQLEPGPRPADGELAVPLASEDAR